MKRNMFIRFFALLFVVCIFILPTASAEAVELQEHHDTCEHHDLEQTDTRSCTHSYKFTDTGDGNLHLVTCRHGCGYNQLAIHEIFYQSSVSRYTVNGYHVVTCYCICNRNLGEKNAFLCPGSGCMYCV